MYKPRLPMAKNIKTRATRALMPNIKTPKAASSGAVIETPKAECTPSKPKAADT
jgi:hypothetical protein